MKRGKYKKHKTLGRPTHYNPAYCQLLINHLSEGRTVTSFCNHFMINHKTFYNWIRRYPDFSYTFEIAQAKCIAYYERLLRLSMFGKVKIHLGLVARRVNYLRRWGFGNWRENCPEGYKPGIW